MAESGLPAWPWWARVVGARSLHSAGFSLVMLASPELLLEINGGDLAAADRVRALVETACAVAGLLSRPLSGALVDAYGRRPAMVAGSLLSALGRVCAVTRPSNASYVAYRVLNQVALAPLTQAFGAMLADRLGGRGTPAFVRAHKLVFSWLAVVRISTQHCAGQSRLAADKRASIALAALCSLAAALAFALAVPESLPDAQRRPLVLSRAANPLGFLAFFASSRRLAALAVLRLATAVPVFNQTGAYYRRAKFNFAMREQAHVLNIANALEVAAPLYSVPLLRRLGARRTAVLGQWAGAAACLAAAATHDARTLLALPLLTSLFDSAAFDAFEAIAQRGATLGQGELGAAMENLYLPLSLALPTAFSALFTASLKWTQPRWRGTAPLLVQALLHALNASFIVPWAVDTITRDAKRRRAPLL
jgi:DHA1 family tetracycline resistance protein-like MFS transporter